MLTCVFIPLGAHGAGYNSQSRLLISEVSFDYLERYLKGNFNLPNLNEKKAPTRPVEAVKGDF